jgi:diketogulonate reductase-like aldo/keto reductase
MCILLPLREPKEFCQKNGIVLQAYASLGSGDAKQAQLEGWR